METRKIKKIIEPQFSSEMGGIHWFRSLTPADTSDANPFIALDIFRSNQTLSYKNIHTSRFLQGVTQFSYLFSGKYSVRINQNQVYHTRTGDIIGVNPGYGANLEEVYVPETGKIDGFHIRIRQRTSEKQLAPSAYINNFENRKSLHQNHMQVQPIWGYDLNPQEDLIIPDSDIKIIDVKMSDTTDFEWETEIEDTVLIFIYQGRGYFGPYMEFENQLINRFNVLLFTPGKKIKLSTQDTPLAFIMVSAKPIIAEVKKIGSHIIKEESV